MTAQQFRKLALSMPEAEEGAHMGHPDFRVKGKIFATLLPREGDWCMVKLTPPQQREFVKKHPGVFEPAAGAWGKQGCTLVRLAGAKQTTLRRAIFAAWLNTAPKRLIEETGLADEP
jgi:hypothetical protein